MPHTCFHNFMTSWQRVNLDCHGTKRPASTRWGAHTYTFRYPKPFSQALVCWWFFWPSSVCKALSVSRGEASSKDWERIFTFNLGKIECAFFSPSSQQCHKGDFPFCSVYCSAVTVSVQEGSADSALSSDMASQMAKSTVKQQKKQTKPMHPIPSFPEEGLFHVL